MKRKVYLLAVLLLTVCLSYAEEVDRHDKVFVRGCVTEYQTNAPIEQATVQLFSLPDSTFQTGAVTNDKGVFMLAHALHPGKYMLAVSYVGYKALTHDITIEPNQRFVPVDSLVMKSHAVWLKEAIIEAHIAQVEVSKDTVIFNAETFRVPEGSVLEELIRKLPGYEVEDDGSVTYNGQKVKKILVDGKEFFENDKEMAMKNLPAEMVKKVKSYERKSDLARMTGIDDGEDELVMDLTVKPDARKGWFGALDGAYGRPLRHNTYDINNLYSGKAMLSRFKENENYSVMLSTNNVNDKGFPGGGGRFGGSNNGMNASTMGGFNMARNFGKEMRKNEYQFSLGGSVRFFYKDSDVQSKSATETFLSTGHDNSFSNSRNQSNSESLRVNGDLRFEWMPDTMTNILFRPGFSYGKNSSRSDNLSATFNEDPYDLLDEFPDNAFEPLDSAWTHEGRVNFSNRQSKGSNENTSVRGVLQINRRLNDKGRNITLKLNGGYSTSFQYEKSTSFTRFYQRNDSTSVMNRYNTTPSKSYNYGGRLMYSEPLWKGAYLQVSYEADYRYNDQKRSTFDLPDSLDRWHSPDWMLPDDYDRFLSDDLSRFATYENFDQDIVAQLRMYDEKYQLNVGFSLLPQRSKMSYAYMGLDIDTVRTVFNFTPTVNFNYKWTDQRTMRLRYRGRSNQPSMTDLLPIVDDSNPLNVTMGNPGLKPTFTNSLQAQFQDFNIDRLQNISANLQFESTLNSIVNKITYNPETGGRTSQPTNLGGWWSDWNVGGALSYNTALPNQRFKVSTSTQAAYRHQEGYVRTATERNHFPLSTTHSVNVSEHLSATYQNDWFEVSLNGKLRYNHAYNRLQQSANRDTYIFSYGPSTNIMLPWWGMKISTNIAMNSRRGFSDPEFNTDELIWNAQLSASFLRKKAATLSLQFYDILGQQSNVSRMVNASMRSDTEYNSVNSYFMVHFIYRFNLFGDKSSRAKMKDMPFNKRGGGGYMMRPEGRYLRHGMSPYSYGSGDWNGSI